MDAAIVDGAAHMLNLILSARQNGLVADVRGQSIHDSAPFYDTYVCADGHHITLGTLEPQFYALLLDTLSLADGPKTRTSQARNGTRPLGPRAGRGWRLCFWRGHARTGRHCWSPPMSALAPCSVPWKPPSTRTCARGVYTEHQGVFQAVPAPRFDAGACLGAR